VKSGARLEKRASITAGQVTFIGQLTTKLEAINHGNAPTGFSVVTAADLHSLTFPMESRFAGCGYRIKFYPPGPGVSGLPGI